MSGETEYRVGSPSPSFTGVAPMSRTTLFGSLLLAIAAILPFPSLARAQAPGVVPVYVAVPETFPDIEARSILLRERGRDIVVLRASDATPATLAMSLALLERVRIQHPSPENGQMIPLTGYAMTSPPYGVQLQRIDQALERLEAAPTRQVGSFGPGRWVVYGGR